MHARAQEQVTGFSLNWRSSSHPLLTALFEPILVG